MKEKLHEKMESIREKGLERLSEFFGMGDEEIAEKDPDLVKTKRDQATMALRLNRDMSLDSRAETSHRIRVATLVTENKEELREILKTGVRKYIE